MHSNYILATGREKHQKRCTQIFHKLLYEKEAFQSLYLHKSLTRSHSQLKIVTVWFYINLDSLSQV